MQSIEILVGIPASGKSTYATQLAKQGWVRVNNDDLRETMFNSQRLSQEDENLVKAIRQQTIREAVRCGKNVVVDNLNINRKNFVDICNLVKDLGKPIQVYEKSFYVELDEAIKRDSKRSRQVGEEVIRTFWKKSGGKSHKFYQPRKEVFFPNPPPAEQDPTLTKAVVCDLDGTLALINGRSPYDATNCDQDLPNVPVVETLLAMRKSGYELVFCSGREDKFREPTISFIKRVLQTEDFELHMRSTGDFRKDAVIKQELYEKHIQPFYYVQFVLDDRNQVVDFWRSIGLTCFQVAPGDF